MNKLRTLKITLDNDLGWLVRIEELDWAEGFVLRDFDTGAALYTAYVAPAGYSSYVAVGDVWKGYDIDDERPLVVSCPSVFTAVSKIKSHMVACGYQFPALRELYEGAAEELRSIDCFRTQEAP